MSETRDDGGGVRRAARCRPWTPTWRPTRSRPSRCYATRCRCCPIDIGSSPGVLLSRKEEIDFALRHPEIFSSNMDAVDLKNKRPMIPLQIDPPEHKKFRKLLDPIFAPRKMALMDQEVSELVNHLIDGFIERGELDFAKEFSIPFPSQVFLTLLGLPLDELDRFLTMKDGIIRPDHVTGKLYGSQEASDYQQTIADSVYDYFNEVLDQREKERKDDLLVALPRCRGRGRPPHPRGHPRHLLPLPHRRARHRHRHPRLHVRLPGPAPRAPPAAGRGPRHHPRTPSRSSSAGRRPVMGVVAGRRRGHRAGRLPGAQG